MSCETGAPCGDSGLPRRENDLAWQGKIAAAPVIHSEVWDWSLSGDRFRPRGVLAASLSRKEFRKRTCVGCGQICR
ncbi:hypothetical protein MESS4_280101 [Mesorhizobium sp. STM 4661]|nr:hypothetical protein MESS4_280101 [Mesorhizobium sp. STM 4661]